MAMKKINSSDRCPHCGHWSGDEERGFRIYSKARAKWLEKAAKMLENVDGDDGDGNGDGDNDWVDWVDDGEKLTKKGE